MREAHGFVGQVAIVLGLVAAGWSIALVVTRRTPGSLFLANFVWVFLAVAVAAALGAATLVSGAPLRDGLHVVYAVLALGVLPGAMVIASGRPGRQRSIVAAASAVVLLILLARLVQTGS
ncbi:MAG: hypothetical protein NVS9B8_00530 [Candidatus Limnocylindrales bacterium]